VNYELQMVAACLRRSAAGRQVFSLRSLFGILQTQSFASLRTTPHKPNDDVALETSLKSL